MGIEVFIARATILLWSSAFLFFRFVNTVKTIMSRLIRTVQGRNASFSLLLICRPLCRRSCFVLRSFWFRFAKRAGTNGFRFVASNKHIHVYICLFPSPYRARAQRKQKRTLSSLSTANNDVGSARFAADNFNGHVGSCVMTNYVAASFFRGYPRQRSSLNFPPSGSRLVLSHRSPLFSDSDSAVFGLFRSCGIYGYSRPARRNAVAGDNWSSSKDVSIALCPTHVFRTNGKL